MTNSGHGGLARSIRRRLVLTRAMIPCGVGVLRDREYVRVGTNGGSSAKTVPVALVHAERPNDITNLSHVVAKRDRRLGAYPKIPSACGRGWGEGRQWLEWIEKTSSDSSHPHPRPLSRRTGEGRLWDGLLRIGQASLLPRPGRCNAKVGALRP